MARTALEGGRVRFRQPDRPWPIARDSYPSCPTASSASQARAVFWSVPACRPSAASTLCFPVGGYHVAEERLHEPLFPPECVELGRNYCAGALIGQRDQLSVELQRRGAFRVAEPCSDGGQVDPGVQQLRGEVVPQLLQRAADPHPVGVAPVPVRLSVWLPRLRALLQLKLPVGLVLMVFP